MIGSVCEEGSVGFREACHSASITLRKDDLVKEFDGRIFGTRCFTLVDKFVEGLRFAEHLHVIAIAMGNAFYELIHVEMVEHARFASIAGSRV